MTRYVALLRGINVGGHRKIAMADLKETVAGCGFSDVAHYVQSGNLVFTDARGAGGEDAQDAAGIADTLEAAISARFGFAVDVMVLSGAAFRAEVAVCPFADGGTPGDGREAKFLQLGFFADVPDAVRVESLLAAYDGPEEVALRRRTLHIYFAAGTARSKLHPLLTEKKLGLPVTARNWNTVQKLLAMLDG
jgi:uncharacterized protein (DUF1697 family)